MMDFPDLDGFVRHLSTLSDQLLLNQHSALQHVGQELEKDVKATYGNTQVDWQAYAPSTLMRRHELGHPDNEMLLMEGPLRESVSHTVDETKVVVGATSEYATAHEFGKEKIPARPVFSKVGYWNTKHIRDFMHYVSAKSIASQPIDVNEFVNVGSVGT